MPSFVAMSEYRLPRDIVVAGPQRAWVVGRVVACKQRDVDDKSDASQAPRDVLPGKRPKGKAHNKKGGGKG